jgi:hypothetical protein
MPPPARARLFGGVAGGRCEGGSRWFASAFRVTGGPDPWHGAPPRLEASIVTEWFYKVIPAKAAYDDTRLLAKRDGFLCRSAHTKNEALVDEVRGPAIGDTLHFYFVELRRTPRPLGSFEIVGAEGHPHAAWFGAQVEGTALFRVTNPGFASQLRAFGEYKEDSVLKEFTGWLLKATGATPPPLPPAMCIGRVTQLKKREG